MARAPRRPGIDPDISKLAAAGNDTIFLDKTGRRFVTVTGAVANDTLYLKAVGNDTLYGGGAGRSFNTVFAKSGNDTIFSRSGNDTLRPGLAQKYFDTVPGGNAKAGSNVITANVIDADTRRPVSVTYNRQTGQYFDKQSQRWSPAPAWMRQQLR